MFDQGRFEGSGSEGSGSEGSGSGGGKTPGQVLADRIADRDVRIRAEEVGTVLDLKEWLDLHSVDQNGVDESDPLATGPAGGAGRRSGSDGTPWVDEFAVAEYGPLRHWSIPTARAFMIDVADLEHRFPRLWSACTVEVSVPVWQARQIVKACRDLSKTAAAKVDAEIAGKLPRLPWGRALSVLAAAIMTADPQLAETKRREAKQARFVQLCRSEGGIRTMIVRAEDGDLIMVYALVDRLADILQRDGSLETADQRRATAFGLLAQPAQVLQMLIRHADDDQPGAGSDNTGSDNTGSDNTGPGGTGPGGSGSAAGAGAAGPATTPDPDQAGAGETAHPDDSQERTVDPDQPDSTSQHTAGPDNDPDAGASRPRDPNADGPAPGSGRTPNDAGGIDDNWPEQDWPEPPPWTADDSDEPPDPAPVDDAPIPDRWRQQHRSNPGPEPFAPTREADLTNHDAHDPDPPAPSGVRLDPPGLADLLTDHRLRATRPKVVLHVHLTDTTLATGTGVVRTDGSGPILASQLREFLGKHSCHISVRPILDPDRVPAVDAYEIPHTIREAVRTRHVASVFPYSAGQGASMDLDHTAPYRWDGTPGQTGPATLGPLTRGEHRAKTHGLWTLTTPHPGVFIWRAPHGHYFLTTNQGTQHLGPLPTQNRPRADKANTCLQVKVGHRGDDSCLAPAAVSVGLAQLRESPVRSPSSCSRTSCSATSMIMSSWPPT